MSMWVGEPADEAKIKFASQALLCPPDTPCYELQGMRGLEIGGGAIPRRLAYEQYDARDWSDRVFHFNGRPVQYTTGDARKLPYEDRSFDHVFSSNLLEHFPSADTVPALREWTRVLVQWGALEVVVPDSMGILDDYFEGRVSWDDTTERLLGSRDYEGNTHYRAFTRAEFPAILAAAGNLELIHIAPSHSGGGVHAVAIRTD